jgi:4-amino-4-deoxy-L-arabinose transferase-like glycosyltransferase
LNNLTRNVFVISAILWFVLLGHRDLIEPDEGRYAEIPREMVASGDWLTPRVDGFKYFEKPPLQYWLTAVSYTVFGESNASARLWLVTGGFLCALFVWFLGTRLYGADVGIAAYVITLSSFLFTILGHYLTLDMSVTLFMTLGVGCLLLAQRARDLPARNRNWMLLGWVALAAAVLTKGLMGIVLPGMAVFLYMLWQRDWAILKYLHLGKGLALLLALTAPWFVAVSLANPEFARFFFIHEHFERYTTTVHQHSAPLYYFVPIFLLGVSPWLIASLRSLVNPGFSWRGGAGEGFNTERFLWVYIVSIFVFFSLGGSKLPSYLSYPRFAGGQEGA